MNCETWTCDGIDFKLVKTACNGQGDCVSHDTCECRGGYIGEFCTTNILYYVVMLPVLTVSGLIGILCIIFCFCCICAVCCVCFSVLALCLGGLFLVVLRQMMGLKKFGRLRNFDLLLKEQELEEDKSVAHLKFNKKLFEIDYDDVHVVKILGEGGSNSIVFRADWQGRVVAFKCFKTRSLISSQDEFNEFEREVEVMSSLSHPNIIRFFGACLNPPRVGIVMEYCPNGEILDFVTKFRNEYNGQAYPIFEKIRLFIEISSSLEFIHSKNIIHRDIKSENILISESYTAKLMDFGLSRLFKERMSEAKKTKRIGTSYYMSPEIVNMEAEYDQKCDIFSFSILMCIVLSEISNPYKLAEGSKNMFQIEIKVANDADFRPNLDDLMEGKYEDDVSLIDWMKELMSTCWDADPSKRYSSKEIRELLEKKVGEVEGNEERKKKVTTYGYLEDEIEGKEKKQEKREEVNGGEFLISELQKENSLLKERLLQIEGLKKN